MGRCAQARWRPFEPRSRAGVVLSEHTKKGDGSLRPGKRRWPKLAGRSCRRTKSWWPKTSKIALRIRHARCTLTCGAAAHGRGAEARTRVRSSGGGGRGGGPRARCGEAKQEEVEEEEQEEEVEVEEQEEEEGLARGAADDRDQVLELFELVFFELVFFELVHVQRRKRDILLPDFLEQLRLQQLLLRAARGLPLSRGVEWEVVHDRPAAAVARPVWFSHCGARAP